MQNAQSSFAHSAKAWPFEQARALLARLIRTRLDSSEARDLANILVLAGKFDELVQTFAAFKSPVIFETGYGPSGLPHIGTFGEVSRTTMVRAAFRALTDDQIPTQLICFSDDMDGLRKVPDNIENKAVLEADLNKPLTVVRDPFGQYPSFGEHNNARLRAFLDGFGFEYTFMSSTEAYRSGRFDDTLLKALAHYDDIQKVMLPTLGEERRSTYSPFLPISPKSGKVLQVPTLERHVDRGTIVFADEDGTLTEVSVTGGAVKMQWKPDWAMRWAALGVDYEMSGKDLIDSVRVSNQICKILGGVPPEGFNYELFLDEDGQKISKSKGNGLTMEDWLRYGTPQSLSYYMFQSPKSAKRLFFDVIPKATDDYLQQLDAYQGQDPAKQIDNPVWHVHTGRPPQYGSPVSFSLLLNLVSAANASDKAILWGFLSRYIPGATPESQPLLDQLAGYAINYYEDFVRPTKAFRAPDSRERGAMEDLADRLKDLGKDCTDAELIQNEVYAAGKMRDLSPCAAGLLLCMRSCSARARGRGLGPLLRFLGLSGRLL
jgi:lysyl-tRNA synthetase class 1